MTEGIIRMYKGYPDGLQSVYQTKLQKPTNKISFDIIFYSSFLYTFFTRINEINIGFQTDYNIQALFSRYIYRVCIERNIIKEFIYIFNKAEHNVLRK